MSFELTGKLIVADATQQITATFKKREFVIEVEEENAGRVFTDYIKFQLMQDKCDVLDSFPIGSTLTVKFSIKGNKWEKEGKVNYFTSLNAFYLSGAQGTDNPLPTQEEQPQASEENNDDLPF